LANQLIQEEKELYIDNPNNDIWLQGSVFTNDATKIILNLTAFCWATFRSTKGGIKLQTQFDLSTSIPEFIPVTPSSVQYVKKLDIIKIAANDFTS
jgi:hypothetical protein